MESFMKENGGEFARYYFNLEFIIQKCDFFRFFVVYKLGGIYLDIDVFLIKSFEYLLPQIKIFFPCEKLLMDDQLLTLGDRDALRIANYEFGSVAEHPFILTFLDKMSNLNMAQFDK